MQKITLRGGSADPDRKCSRCHKDPYEIAVDGIELCEECLVKAVLRTSGDPDAKRNYEVQLLAGELTRLTGKSYRLHGGKGLHALPTEEITELRRAIRDVEDTKSRANRKLRQFGLPGV